MLVEDGANEEITKSMQLIAGRTAQEYNRRKKRQGALWGDRYHATAVDTNHYLIGCLTYIDLNMVRAGKVSHPKDWKQSGYNEIQNPPKRYQIINRKRLCELTGIQRVSQLKIEHARWIEDALETGSSHREEKWTTSLAVGSHAFAENYLDRAGSKASYRKMKIVDDCTVIKEPQAAYNDDLWRKK